MYILNITGPLRTKVLIIGTRSQVAKFDSSAGISIGDTAVKISTIICVLGVTADQYLTFDDHVTKVVSSSNNHIHSLHHILHLIN